MPSRIVAPVPAVLIRPALRPRVRFAVLGVFVLLICARMPQLVLHTRFWAEEGQIYFARAWNLPWHDALLRPALGYLNLPANAATLAARYAVPLLYAPRITTTIALLFQTIPAFLIVTSRDPWLQRAPVLLAAVILLATPPIGDEVWLNSITSQFHVAVAAALILALQVPTGITFGCTMVLLLLTPLCSPVSAVLTPLFLVRALLERDRGRLLQFACIGLGGALQFGFFVRGLNSRSHGFDAGAFAALLTVQHLALPLFGRFAAQRVADALQQALRAGHSLWPVDLLLFSVAALGMAALAIKRHAAATWLAGAAVLLAAASDSLGLVSGIDGVSPDYGQRYGHAPSVLLSLTVLALATGDAGRIAGTARMLVIWLAAVGLIQTRLPHWDIVAHGPKWNAEVAKWRADPSPCDMARRLEHDLAGVPALSRKYGLCRRRV